MINNKNQKQVSTYAPGYFITFTTYGKWLHGDKRGSVDYYNNQYGTPVLKPNTMRTLEDRQKFKNEPVQLNQQLRHIVQHTVEQVCIYRDWTLHAINVRTNHVHIVVSADQTPERVMIDFKSWCTRRLVEAGLVRKGIRIWTRHGSTRYIWNENQLQNAGRYVVEDQGVDI